MKAPPWEVSIRVYNVLMALFAHPTHGQSRAARLCRLLICMVVVVVSSKEAKAKTVGVVDLRPQHLLQRSTLQKQIFSEFAIHDIHIADNDIQHALLGNLDSIAWDHANRVIKTPKHCTDNLAILKPLWIANALGFNVSEELISYYIFLLQCADDRGQNTLGHQIAMLLRNLEPTRPAHAALLANYPVVDATANRALGELSIEGQTGADVFIDHRWVGKTPFKQFLARGHHAVALTLAGQGMAWFVDIKESTTTLTTEGLNAKSAAHTKADRFLRTWREDTSQLTAEQIDTLMSEFNLTHTVVIHSGQNLSLWKRSELPGTSTLAIGHATSIAPIREALLLQLALPMDNEEIESIGLARQPAPLQNADPGGIDTHWWLIGGVVSAAIITSFFIVSSEVGDETQTIEVTIP